MTAAVSGRPRCSSRVPRYGLWVCAWSGLTGSPLSLHSCSLSLICVMALPPCPAGGRVGVSASRVILWCQTRVFTDHTAQHDTELFWRAETRQTGESERDEM